MLTTRVLDIPAYAVHVQFGRAQVTWHHPKGWANCSTLQNGTNLILLPNFLITEKMRHRSAS